ncbi:MAG: exosortase/archaeosortase family protein [Isosphaeraceae bacterium]
MATVPDESPAQPSTPRRLAEPLALALVLAAFGWSFWPGFAYLADRWDQDPNYSYGYFVIPIAAFILWSRRGLLDRSKLNPKWWGFLPLLALLALRYPLFEWNEQYVERAMIPLVAGSLALAVGGWHLLRFALPGVIFLFFLLPLPQSWNLSMAAPLQRVATIGSVGILQVLGLPVMAEGNVILVGQEALEVARACNGLSMLLSFVTLITATVILIKRPWYERLALLLSAVPIAIFSNVLRIVVTGLVYHLMGHEAGEKIAAHEFAGWAMMPLALALVWLELKVLSWLYVEEDVIDARGLLRRGPARPLRSH